MSDNNVNSAENKNNYKFVKGDIKDISKNKREFVAYPEKKCGSVQCSGLENRLAVKVKLQGSILEGM